MQIRENLFGTFSLLRTTSTIGMPRKLLFCSTQSSGQRKLLHKRQRIFFVLDRTNGEHLLTAPFIDRHGRPASTCGRPIAAGSNAKSRWRAGGRVQRIDKLMALSFDPQRAILRERAENFQRLLQHRNRQG
jgi:hypothetical protein